MDQSELQGRLAQLEEQARAAHAAFMGKSRNVSGLINAARGANVTNLAWGNAQVALADLDSHRSQTAIALADADLLYADRAVALASRQNIAKTRDLISALLDEEDRVLAQLRRGLEQ